MPFPRVFPGFGPLKAILPPIVMDVQIEFVAVGDLVNVWGKLDHTDFPDWLIRVGVGSHSISQYNYRSAHASFTTGLLHGSSLRFFEGVGAKGPKCCGGSC